MTLPISTLVDIGTEERVGGVLSSDFGLGLMVSLNEKLSASGSGKVQVFADLASLVTALGVGTTDKLYQSANAWFSADPAPKSLAVGRWANVAVNSSLTGGAAVTLATIRGAKKIKINDTEISTSINATTGTAAQYAAALQTAARTALSDSGLTVTESSGVLTITRSDAGALSYVTAADSTDASAGTGLTQADNATLVVGHAKETLAQALANMIDAMSDAPTALMLGGDAPLTLDSADSRIELAKYAQAGDYMCGVKDTAANALAAGETTSLAYQIFNGSYSKAECVYSIDDEYPEVGMMALLSAQELDLPVSTITQHAKVMPGVQTSPITVTQLANLKVKRCNVYTQVGRLPTLLGGYTGKAGSWGDAQWWLLWLKRRMEEAIFAAQRASRRFSTAELDEAITGVMSIAQQNGGLQFNGRLNASTTKDVRAVTGIPGFNGVVPGGYMHWVQPLYERTEVDRNSRNSSFKVWMAPSEAIHNVTGTIVLSG